MRNLKKVLALVLAMAMSLSLAVTAGAAFNDQDKIVNTEAVDMCVALNIINGRTNGDFDPAGNVTRAEAAKMICIALNGGKEPVLSASATPVFADIAGHWAAKYIEYCVSEGIVAGKSATSFDPNGNVTGTELAKMLLIALGYNAEHAKFLGANWDTNVNVVASQKDLYEDLESIDPAVALSRDNAAQMIWNALQALTVEYDYTLVSNNGSLTSQVVVKNTNDTLLWETYDGVVAKTTLTSVSYNDDKGEWTYNNTYTCEEDYCELYQQAVKVVYTTTGAKDGPVDDFLGMISDSDIIASNVIGNIESVDTANAEVEIDDVDYKLDKAKIASVPVYAFLTGQPEGEPTTLSALMLDTAKAPLNFQAIDKNDDGRIDVIVYMPATVAQITYVNASGIRVGATPYDFDDHNIYEGAAKDDWVIIIDAANTCNGEAVITKAEVVEGKVTSVETDGDVRVNGTWYTKACTDTTPAISADVELVVANGFYFNVDASTTELDVAVVTGIGNYNNMDDTQEVRLMFEDGSEEIVAVEAWNANEESAFNSMSETLVEYEIDDDLYTLTTVANAGDLSGDYVGLVTAAGLYDESFSSITVGSNDYDVADNAMIVLYDSVDDEYTYMTGADLLSKNDISFTAMTAAVDSNEIGAALISTTASVTTGDELYGYIVDAYTALNADEDEVLYIDVIIDGEKKYDVETDVKTSSAAGYINTVVTYTMDGEVMCIEADSDTYTVDAIDEFSATRVLFHNAARALVTSDTVIIAIDSDDADDVLYAGNALMEANADHWNSTTGVADGWLNNAMFKVNSDNEIEVIFVEVDDVAEFAAE